MLDDLDRLRTSEPLLQLLTHYGQLAEPQRDVWHDRLMSMEGVEPRELTKLHGLLIAMDWVELKCGQMVKFVPGAVPACYRVTGSGLRALRKVKAPELEAGGDEAVEVPVEPKPPGRKREKKVEEESTAAAA